jgi:hypothetical protein
MSHDLNKKSFTDNCKVETVFWGAALILNSVAFILSSAQSSTVIIFQSQQSLTSHQVEDPLIFHLSWQRQSRR